MTVKEWLNTLPAGLKKSALKQPDKIYLYNECINLSTALNIGFLWQETEEGFEFWEALHYMLRWAETGNENILILLNYP